jgi:predicted AlkP superfamily phosphohydrolase/phosphomutase
MTPAPVLVFGIDGADFDVVEELLAAGRTPTLARLRDAGAYGPLRSTEPPITPVAWSTFLTGLRPAGHGIYNFSTNPFRGGFRIESAAQRTGAPLWRYLSAAGLRSAMVLIPFTHPVEDVGGVVVSGYGGPERPTIHPPEAAERIEAAFPDLVTAHHPMKERYWEDYDRYRRLLVDNVSEVERLCENVLEHDRPDLFCVDFMSSDTIGHLAWHLRDPEHPAHDPALAADHIGEVYDAVDAAIGRLIARAEQLYDRPVNAIVLSDHGMKPIHHVFHVNRWLEQRGHLRFRRRSAQRIPGLARVDSYMALRHRWYPGLYDRLVPFGAAPATANRTMRDIDRWRTDAYAYGTGGPVFLGESTGRRGDRAFRDRLIEELRGERSPFDGSPAFTVLPGDEVHRGRFADKAPDIVITANDPRILIDSSRRAWPSPWVRHEHLDPSHNYGFSGHHGPIGIIAAAGPSVSHAAVDGAEIADLAPTVLTLMGVDAEAEFDGRPLPQFRPALDPVALAADDGTASDQTVYSGEEERAISERLEALGYE